jgi:Spy/CpxP family protein refolding chaperone
MKLIKALVFTVFAAGLIAGSSALGQDSTGASAPTSSTNAPAPRPHAMFRGTSIDRLAEILNLTETQKAQVQSILTAQGQKMRALRHDTSLSADDRRSQMKEILNDTSAQLQPILTPEQLAKWQNMAHAHHSMPKAATPVSTNAPAGSAP